MKNCLFGLIIWAVFTATAAYVVNPDLTSSEERMVNETIDLYRLQISEIMMLRMEAIAYDVCDSRRFPNFEQPVRKTIRNLEQLDIYSHSVCQLLQNYFEPTAEPIIKAFDSCFSNREAKVATYVAKAIVSASKYVCRINGEHIMEFLNPCIPAIELGNCEETSSTKWRELTRKTDTTFGEMVCKKYGDMRTCVENEIKDKCKQEVTRQSVMGLLDSLFETPCISDEDNAIA